MESKATEKDVGHPSALFSFGLPFECYRDGLRHWMMAFFVLPGATGANAREGMEGVILIPMRWCAEGRFDVGVAQQVGVDMMLPKGADHRRLEPYVADLLEGAADYLENLRVAGQLDG